MWLSRRMALPPVAVALQPREEDRPAGAGLVALHVDAFALQDRRQEVGGLDHVARRVGRVDATVALKGLQRLRFDRLPVRGLRARDGSGQHESGTTRRRIMVRDSTLLCGVPTWDQPVIAPLRGTRRHRSAAGSRICLRAAVGRTAGNRLVSYPSAPAPSRDALQRHPPGVMHRQGSLATARITGTRLAARNRLADFRLRLALAVLYGVLRQTRLPGRRALMRIGLVQLIVQS